MFSKTLIKASDVTTHHFFSVDEHWSPILRDPDGAIQVFTDRDRSEAEARKIVGSRATVITIGMGDAKWELFQQTETHRVVE